MRITTKKHFFKYILKSLGFIENIMIYISGFICIVAICQVSGTPAINLTWQNLNFFDGPKHIGVGIIKYLY